MMAMVMGSRDAGGHIATERGAPTRQRLDSGNPRVLDHTTPKVRLYPWT